MATILLVLIQLSAVRDNVLLVLLKDSLKKFLKKLLNRNVRRDTKSLTQLVTNSCFIAYTALALVVDSQERLISTLVFVCSSHG